MWHLFGSVLNKHASYIWRFVDQDISAALKNLIITLFVTHFTFISFFSFFQSCYNLLTYGQ